MKKKVTMQDIANISGFSRNTVSKALNNHPDVSDTTKNKIIQLAKELNYKNFSLQKARNIALLTRSDINAISFYSETIKGIETKLSSEGYNLILTLVGKEEIRTNKLPTNINHNNVSGIVCIEIFDKSYINTVLGAGIPTVFIDFPPNTVFPEYKFDILIMENELATYNLTKLLIANGNERIGFIGDLFHCRSFYERWLGFERALRESGIPAEHFNITLNDDNPYLSVEWMIEQLRKLVQLPTAFVCANDDIGITVIRALKEMNIDIPGQIEVVGFDDIPNSEIIVPPLTTVHTYPYELGTRVVESLLVRIESPKRHSEIIHMETKVIKRGSTK